MVSCVPALAQSEGNKDTNISFNPIAIYSQALNHHLSLTRQPYLDIATSEGVNIHWRTNGSTQSVVQYGTAYNNLSESLIDTVLKKNHVVTLSGLAPNRKYYYSIGNNTQTLQGDSNNYFYTAPIQNSEEKIRFWVTGDFGQAGFEQTAVAQSFINYNNNQKINAWLWLGDNAYNSGTEQEYQNNVFSVFPQLLKNIPLFPAIGNHDYGNHAYQSPQALGVNFPYFSIFNLPEQSGTEKYYAYNYGNVHFIALDSYGAYNKPGSPMYTWLQNDLANNHAKWIVVYFHHPPYTKGTHNSDTEQELIDMRNNIVPLLESFHVDLVLCGHSHIYERSYFMKGHLGLETDFNAAQYPQGNIVQSGYGPFIKTSLNPHGTVYVVNGSGSKTSNWVHPGYPHNAMLKSIENKTGSVILEIEKDTLNCSFVQSDGIIGDNFQIIKRQVIAPYEKSMNNNLQIYPNPVSQGITIHFNHLDTGENVVTIKIFDLAGKMVLQLDKTLHKNLENNLVITKAELQNHKGIFLIEISNNGTMVQSEKIVLE
jgi:hypothetical protein